MGLPGIDKKSLSYDSCQGVVSLLIHHKPINAKNAFAVKSPYYANSKAEFAFA
jgi:hypothetical protein